MARWIWFMLGGLVAAGLAAVMLGAWRWQRGTATVVGAMDASSEGVPVADDAPFDPASVESLPPPVRRYLRWAIAPGRRPVRHAAFGQEGDFAVRPGQWTRFVAEQHVTTAPRAFVWSARMSMVGVIPVHVRDAYRDGQGSMRAAIAGWIPVADAHDTPAMANGALLRWLAEAAWYPTALLPSQGVRWEAIDDSTARATLTDGVTTVSLDVGFGADGGIARTRAMRFKDGESAAQPWLGRFTEYRRVDGLMIPMRGEVGWGEGAAYEAYWRGRLLAPRYDAAVER